MSLSAPGSPEPLLTAREAAARLRVSRWTIYREARVGRLTHSRLPGGALRFTQADIDAYVAAGRVSD
jgi:excisionase family DNA binding protein